MSDDEEGQYGLVMPFVSVQSAGGPHDDEAYVCGYEMGNLHAYLEHARPALHEVNLQAANRTQADLIAMQFGYRLELVEHEGGEWLGATFARLADGAAS